MFLRLYTFKVIASNSDIENSISTRHPPRPTRAAGVCTRFRERETMGKTTKCEVVGLNNCNAYIRRATTTDEHGYAYKVETLISYKTPILRVFWRELPDGSIDCNGSRLLAISCNATQASRTTTRHLYVYLDTYLDKRLQPSSKTRRNLKKYLNGARELGFNGIELRGLYAASIWSMPEYFEQQSWPFQRYEPRKPFVNGCFEVKPSQPGAWRVW